MTVFSIGSVAFAFIIQMFADRYGLDWIDVSAQIKAESAFDPKAVSPVGAKGLMQIMDDTAEWLVGISGEVLFDPRTNIGIGTYYMRYLVKFWSKRGVKDYRFALASYNCGPNRVLRIWRKVKGGYGEIESRLPLETKVYVKRITRWASIWKDADNLNGEDLGELSTNNT